MRSQKFKLEYEDKGITCLLGMYISKTGTPNDKTINIIMNRHIDRRILLTVMYGCTPKDTPSN